MVEAPTPSALRDAAGISLSYASMILGGSRQPGRSLALHIYRSTGWRHGTIAELTDEQIAVLESLEQWTPRKALADEIAA